MHLIPQRILQEAVKALWLSSDHCLFGTEMETAPPPHMSHLCTTADFGRKTTMVPHETRLKKGWAHYHHAILCPCTGTPSIVNALYFTSAIERTNTIQYKHIMFQSFYVLQLEWVYFSDSFFIFLLHFLLFVCVSITLSHQ